MKVFILTLVALACASEAAPITIGLRKGPLRPVGSIRQKGRSGLTTGYLADTDVPIRNFMDAQVSARCRKLAKRRTDNRTRDSSHPNSNGIANNSNFRPSVGIATQHA